MRGKSHTTSLRVFVNGGGSFIYWLIDVSEQTEDCARHVAKRVMVAILSLLLKCSEVGLHFSLHFTSQGGERSPPV